MPVRAAKGEATRQLVIDTALDMFRVSGYAQTTMRAIASAAGLSLGSAYYYFSSKEELVQELYLRSVQEQSAGFAAAVADHKTLAPRLRTAMHAGIDALAPYHGFGSTFIGSALPPSSSVNPFGDPSAAPREAAVALFREVAEGSGVPAALRDDLPELLWLGYMAVVLFWIYDRSPEQQRTRKLIDGAAPLVARLVALAKLPVARRLVQDALKLRRSVRL